MSQFIKNQSNYILTIMCSKHFHFRPKIEKIICVISLVISQILDENTKFPESFRNESETHFEQTYGYFGNKISILSIRIIKQLNIFNYGKKTLLKIN